MNQESSDADLLRQFTEERSEAAFTALVQRHVDLVYSAALRQLRGNAQLAADAAQVVFCELSRNAGMLRQHRTLSGWLYTTSRFVASRMARTDLRRRSRESRFGMNNNHESPSESWSEIEHLLDDAMQDLSADDREAVLLRYFQNQPFGKIGAALGASENAARMRVDRALDKLRAALERRGITCPSAVLSALLTANAVSSAPVGIAATIAAPAIAAAGASGFLNLLNMITTTKVKTTVAVLALAGTTTGWLTARKEAAKLEAEMAVLRQKPENSGAEVVDSGPQLSTEDLERLRAERLELMRLRGEVTDLRRRLAERVAPAPTRTQIGPAASPSDDEERAKDELKARGIAKMVVAKHWGLAFNRFAEQNAGRMPLDFAQAATASPEILREMLNVQNSNPVDTSGDSFEITFQGRLDQIENPSEAVIMREKQPFHFGSDGSASKAYLFADGHSEIHKAANGDFEEWEGARLPRLKREGLDNVITSGREIPPQE